MSKRKKSKKSKNRYVPDVIAYYGKSNKTTFFNTVSNSSDIHSAAEKIFGISRYIDFDTLTRNDII